MLNRWLRGKRKELQFILAAEFASRVKERLVFSSAGCVLLRCRAFLGRYCIGLRDQSVIRTDWSRLTFKFSKASDVYTKYNNRKERRRLEWQGIEQQWRGITEADQQRNVCGVAMRVLSIYLWSTNFIHKSNISKLKNGVIMLNSLYISNFRVLRQCDNA